MAESSVRATVTKTALEFVERREEALAKSIRGRLGADYCEQISSTVGVAWIPIERHLELIDAIHVLLGPDRMERLFCEAYVHSFSKLGAIKGFLDATLRVFDRDPFTLARALPRAWGSLSKKCGEFAAPVRLSERSFEVVFSAFPPAMHERPSWIHTFAGVLDGALRHVDARGRTTIDLSRWEDGRLAYGVEWE